MKLLSWNVNGLRAVLKKDFLKFIDEYNPDILGLQETKLQEEQIPEEIYNLKQYYKYWSFAERKGYSGVCLFTKKKPLNVSYSIGDSQFDDEGRIIQAEYEDFILFNIYFPNGQKDDIRLQYKLDFYDQFLIHIESLRKSGKNIIVCGDYNTAHTEIDLDNPKENSKTSGFLPIEREWIDKFISHNYTDTFRYYDKTPKKYSWWSYRAGARPRNVGWRIDYFFVNNEFMAKVQNAYILQEVMGSDHCPVGIDIT
ncbi:MAG: exodeoxyribonuclease III [Candidatus Cloacimonetes bacterium]|jgi:exodeoxyribonuclease-3|nr:exodeoxyribonuclease III [Candidatus Cloacimonadota bacterium]